MFWYVVQYYYPLVYLTTPASKLYTYTFKIQYNSMCNMVNYPIHTVLHTHLKSTHSLTHSASEAVRVPPIFDPHLGRREGEGERGREGERGFRNIHTHADMHTRKLMCAHYAHVHILCTYYYVLYTHPREISVTTRADKVFMMPAQVLGSRYMAAEREGRIP